MSGPGAIPAACMRGCTSSEVERPMPADKPLHGGYLGPTRTFLSVYQPKTLHACLLSTPPLICILLLLARKEVAIHQLMCSASFRAVSLRLFAFTNWSVAFARERAVRFASTWLSVVKSVWRQFFFPAVGRCGAHVVIVALLTACGTTALKPEEKLVSSVTTLPPVSIPIPVRCVDKVPPIPYVKIDPNATPLQQYYQRKEALIAAENFILDQHILLLGCAAKEPKP